MSEHPNTETLADYYFQPDASTFGDLRRHLVTCPDCRNTVDSLGRLHSSAQQPGMSDASVLTHADESEIADLIDHQLDPAQEQAVSARLKNSPAMLKSALHFSANSTAMQRETSVLPAARTSDSGSHKTKTANTGIITRLKNWLDEQSGSWISIPVSSAVTAAVVFALTVSFNNSFTDDMESPSQLSIATYQDNPVINFKSQGTSRPGIGFFDSGPTDTQPFIAIQISLRGSDILDMQWPKIANALEYSINLSMLDADGLHVIYSGTSPKPETRIPHFTPDQGKRYQWEISGQTSDNKTFTTSGGFVAY